MKSTRSSLCLVLIGLGIGFVGGYVFRSFAPGSQATRTSPLTSTSTIGAVRLHPSTRPSDLSRVAEDATTLAVSLANEAAQMAYGTALFTAKGAAASFDGHRWTWKQRVACGLGDLEAEVWLSPNGMTEKLDVQLLISDRASFPR